MSRIPKERLEKALEQLKTISEGDYAKVRAMAGIVRPLRSFLFKTPDDYGMTGWKDIYFPSDDGTPLEGWYIPAKGSAGPSHFKPRTAPPPLEQAFRPCGVSGSRCR
jgi:uncharacterized protein